MDVREKLVELIAQKVCGTWSESCDEWMPHDCGKCYANDCHISEIADHLIAHSVTVQEWISVKDRLPEEECRCLVIDAAGDIEIDCYYGKGRFVLDRIGAYQHPSHWMPLPKLPQPPKGE